MAQCMGTNLNGTSCSRIVPDGTEYCAQHSDDTGVSRCTVIKKNGERCRGLPCLPRKVCKHHGGMSLPAGPDHPRYSHGRTSKAMPERLRESFNDAMNDPKLLEHKRDIALVDTLLEDTVANLDTGESGERWKAVGSALKKYKRALGTRDDVAALAALTDAVEAGVTNYAAQEEIGKLLDRRERLASSERKRELELKQSVSTGEVITMMGRVVEIIHRVVLDPVQRVQVAEEIGKLEYFVNKDTTTNAVRARHAKQGEILQLT